jgi:hypothetical protein
MIPLCSPPTPPPKKKFECHTLREPSRFLSEVLALRVSCRKVEQYIATHVINLSELEEKVNFLQEVTLTSRL